MEFQLDKTQSIVRWVGHQAKKKHFGTVQFKQGKFRASAGEIAGGYAQVDLNTISVNDPKLDRQKSEDLEKHLKSRDFFSIDIHPSAIFEINEVKKSSGTTTHLAYGDMTINGIKHHMEIPVNILVSNEKLDVKARFNLIRTRFGVDYMIEESYGEDKVLPEFEIEIHLVAANLNH